MKFYRVLATKKIEPESGQEEKELTSLQKQNVARKTDAFLEEYEDRACIFFVSLEKETDMAVCVKDNDVDEKRLAERFLERMDVAYEELTVKEISMETFFNGLRISFRGRLISDDDKMAETMGLETFFCERNDFFNEKISDDKKTIEELKIKEIRI